MMQTKRMRLVVLMMSCLTSLLLDGPAQAEDLASAVAAGKVAVAFSGKGASSGDAIRAAVSAARSGGGNLELTVAPGTSLLSGNAGDQNMVIARVKGESLSETTYRPSSVIQVGSQPRTYIFEAYCMEFQKDNPSANTAFSLGRIDPVLTCILTEGAHLSTSSKQAAVWMYTDKATFEQVSHKFRVSGAEWSAAEAVVAKCRNPGAAAKPAAGPLLRVNASEPPDSDGLTLTGVAITGTLKMAVINNMIVKEGESAEVVVGMKRVLIRCVEVTATNVIVELPRGKRSELRMP